MDPARSTELEHNTRVPEHSRQELVRNTLVLGRNTVRALGNMDRSSCSS